MTFASPKNMCALKYTHEIRVLVPPGFDLTTSKFGVYRDDHRDVLYILTQIPF